MNADVRIRKPLLRILLAWGMALVTSHARSAVEDVNIAGTTDGSTSYASYWSDTSLAQTFKVGFTQILAGIELTQDTWSGPLVDMDLSLYRVTSSNSPIGDLLGTLHLLPARDAALVNFEPLQIQLDEGVTYSLVFRSAWGNQNSVAFNPGRHDDLWNYSDSYDGGMMWNQSNGGEWTPFSSWISRDTAGTSDIIMKTFGTPVPEQSTFAMMSLGLALMVLSSRRHRPS